MAAKTGSGHAVGAVAEFCVALNQLRLSSGRDSRTLARELNISRSQLYAILNGKIKTPPDWEGFVRPLVEACTGGDTRAVAEWRRRHAVLGVYEELNRREEQVPQSADPGLAKPAVGVATFGGLLRRLRTDARLTQEELAAAAGVSTRAISDYERGINQTARKDTARLLADALHLIGPAKVQFEAVARGREMPAGFGTAGSTAAPSDEPSYLKHSHNVRQMGEIQPTVHRAILIVDVENFGGSARTDADRLAVRHGMYEALQRSLARAGISWADSTIEDRGDGVLVVLPPELPKAWLVGGLPTYLAETLGEHNASCTAQQQIRLRVALHGGEVRRDAHGFAGASINQAFRLIESSAVKAALRDSQGAIALIVSDWFYEEVVRHYPEAKPSRFHQVQIAFKETEMAAWVRAVEVQGTAAWGDRKKKARTSVFISYSHPDYKFVETLVERLSDAEISVSWDMDLPVGADFSKALVDAIDQSDFVIAIVSPDYLISDWAQGELAAALSSQKRVLPILVRPTAVEGPLQYIQFLDATSEPQLAGEKVIQLLNGARSGAS